MIGSKGFECCRFGGDHLVPLAITRRQQVFHAWHFTEGPDHDRIGEVAGSRRNKLAFLVSDERQRDVVDHRHQDAFASFRGQKAC